MTKSDSILGEKKPIKRRMTEGQWEQIVALYEIQGNSYSELSDLFGISVTAMAKGLAKRGAVKGCRSKVVGDATVAAMRDQHKEEMNKIASMKDTYEGWQTAIARLAMNQVNQQLKIAKDNGATSPNFEVIKGDLSSLKIASSIVAASRDEIYKLKGLYDKETEEDVPPAIGVTEYSSEEIMAIQREAERVRQLGRVGELEEPLELSHLGEIEDNE